MWNKCKTCKWINPYPMQKYCKPECTPDTHFSKRIYNTPNKISKKKIIRLKETWWEKAIFEKVNEIDKFCWVTRKYILEPASFTFPHILAKSKYPALRNFPNNIWRCYSTEEHWTLDKWITNIKKDLTKLNQLKWYIMHWTREEVLAFILLNRNI